MTPVPTASPKTLVQHIRLKAPVARVYRALTDPKELAKWFPDRVQADARVGGEWRFEFQQDAGGIHTVYGRFLALEPDQLVSYNWHEQLDDAGSALANLTVVFRLVPDGQETDLYLEESGYREDAAHETLFGRRTSGWGFFMGNLASYVTGGPDLRLED